MPPRPHPRTSNPSDWHPDPLQTFLAEASELGARLSAVPGTGFGEALEFELRKDQALKPPVKLKAQHVRGLGADIKSPNELKDETTLPRYYQIYHELLSQIQLGELRVGEALPSERQLARHYGVARLTIVKALDLLERHHLISKQQGPGQFCP
ncbi:MAG: GntR family transcriptional regulator [Deinococcales bacterium]